MQLRWFEVYNHNGSTIEKGLQFWNEESGQWEYVPSVRISYKNHEMAVKRKDYY